MRDRRPDIAYALRALVNVQGADEVTLVLTDTDARELADDLDWCARSSDRTYSAKSITGRITRIQRMPNDA